jgi:hypothetical protein
MARVTAMEPAYETRRQSQCQRTMLQASQALGHRLRHTTHAMHNTVTTQTRLCIHSVQASKTSYMQQILHAEACRCRHWLGTKPHTAFIHTSFHTCNNALHQLLFARAQCCNTHPAGRCLERQLATPCRPHTHTQTTASFHCSCLLCLFTPRVASCLTGSPSASLAPWLCTPLHTRPCTPPAGPVGVSSESENRAATRLAGV